MTIGNFELTQAQFRMACEQACQRSIKEECTVHVNAVVRVKIVVFGSKEGDVGISHFEVSDWYNSEATVATYTNGKKHD